MNTALILDVETSGLLPTDRVVEIGAVLWSMKNATTVVAYSSLVDAPSNGARHVNGIPPAALSEGADEDAVWARLAGWVARADVIVAHGAEFDRRWTPSGWDDGKPWVCSMHDIEWPQHSSSRSLVAVVLAHGLGVSHAHRALTDCLHIARLLERCAEMGHDVEDMLRLAARPKALYRAVVSYDDRELARRCGFSWDAACKEWRRRIVPETAGSFPFAVECIG